MESKNQKPFVLSNVEGKRALVEDTFPSYIVCSNIGVQDISFKDNKIFSLLLLQGENIKFCQKFNEVLFVIGIDNEMEVLAKGKSMKQQFLNNQITAIDFDSQELIGKIQFKHEIYQMAIIDCFLVVSFINKIIVCDVYTLKHILKIQADDFAIFDCSIVQTKPHEHNLKLVYAVNGKINIDTYTITKKAKTVQMLSSKSPMEAQISPRSVDGTESRLSMASQTLSTEVTSNLKSKNRDSDAQSNFRVLKSEVQISDPLLKKIVYLKFNSTQTLLAAVVQGGKNIFVIDIVKKAIRVLCVRGMMKAMVKSISFSFDNKYMALTSDSLSVHLFHIQPFLEDQGEGGIPKIKSFINFKTLEVQEEWEKKIIEKQKMTKEQVIEMRKQKKLILSQAANKTLPMVNFISVCSKADSEFELEVVSEKGFYYRMSFTRDALKEDLPSEYDVYCEIKIVIQNFKPN